MSANEPAESIAIELGRLNSTLREVLTDLGLNSSIRETIRDRVIIIHREENGMMETIEPSTHEKNQQGSPELVRFCRMIVAGSNLTGSVSLRVRLEASGPVFVRLWINE